MKLPALYMVDVTLTLKTRVPVLAESKEAAAHHAKRYALIDEREDLQRSGRTVTMTTGRIRSATIADARKADRTDDPFLHTLKAERLFDSAVLSHTDTAALGAARTLQYQSMSDAFDWVTDLRKSSKRK